MKAKNSPTFYKYYDEILELHKTMTYEQIADHIADKYGWVTTANAISKYLAKRRKQEEA